MAPCPSSVAASEAIGVYRTPRADRRAAKPEPLDTRLHCSPTLLVTASRTSADSFSGLPECISANMTYPEYQDLLVQYFVEDEVLPEAKASDVVIDFGSRRSEFREPSNPRERIVELTAIRSPLVRSPTSSRKCQHFSQVGLRPRREDDLPAREGHGAGAAYLTERARPPRARSGPTRPASGRCPHRAGWQPAPQRSRRESPGSRGHPGPPG